MATGLGVALMLIGLAMGRSTPVQLAVAAAAAGYIGSLYLRGISFDTGSPLMAVGLLAASELAHWSIDARVRSLDDVEVHFQRGRSIVLLLAGAMVLVAILDAAAAIGPGGAVLAVPATAALMLGLGLAGRIAWRRSEERPDQGGR
jgi:hypothetical protein